MLALVRVEIPGECLTSSIFSEANKKFYQHLEQYGISSVHQLWKYKYKDIALTFTEKYAMTSTEVFERSFDDIIDLYTTYSYFKEENLTRAEAREKLVKWFTDYGLGADERTAKHKFSVKTLVLAGIKN